MRDRPLVVVLAGPNGAGKSTSAPIVLREALAKARADFAYETTLASRTYAPWLRSISASGYRVHLAFLSLPSPDLAVARVAERVRAGGHHVPEAVVRRRFRAGLQNLFLLYAAIVERWFVWDASQPGAPRPVAERLESGVERIHDREAWRRLKEMAR